jgi:hypothetical protein
MAMARESPICDFAKSDVELARETLRRSKPSSFHYWQSPKQSTFFHQNVELLSHATRRATGTLSEACLNLMHAPARPYRTRRSLAPRDQEAVLYRSPVQFLTVIPFMIP